jgi:hypothetical protein
LYSKHVADEEVIMATTVREDLQEEFLSTLRKGQEIALDALKVVVETVQFVTPPMPAIRVPLAGRLPTAHSMVAGVNDFAGHLLANQRQFADEVITVVSPLLPVEAAKPAAASDVAKPAAPAKAGKPAAA